tara:strand:- start:260 stop:790 length:531 start_codon:yes stop_codon:yes gene_type:complete
MSKKFKSVFSEDDFNSPDGMLTYVWGPPMWHTLHTISFNYPVKPSDIQKRDYMNYFKSLGKVLPCKYCRDNYKENLKKNPITMNVLKNRSNLSMWVYNLHEIINKNLGKKSKLTYEMVKDRYENFRSRCISNSKKKEKGCTVPLYGIKSKCILNIVPKSSKEKSLKIDKKCILKKK